MFGFRNDRILWSEPGITLMIELRSSPPTRYGRESLVRDIPGCERRHSGRDLTLVSDPLDQKVIRFAVGAIIVVAI